MRSPWPCLLLALACAGCPDASKTGKTDDPKTDSAAPDGGSKTGAGEDPLEGSLFSREELFELYRAHLRPDDPASGEVLRKHRLRDASGQPVAARVAAYTRALQRFADKDPKAWSAFIDSTAK